MYAQRQSRVVTVSIESYSNRVYAVKNCSREAARGRNFDKLVSNYLFDK